MSNFTIGGILIAIGCVVLCAATLVIDHFRRENADLQQRLEYSQTAQKVNEEALNILKEANADLLKTLESWKQEYVEITRQNQDAKHEIEELEKQNEAIADVLRGIIPNELWDSLFPKDGNDLSYQN